MATVWALGKAVTTWLRPLCSLPRREFRFLSSPHPSYGMRTGDSDTWLDGMHVALANLFSDMAPVVSQGDLQDDGNHKDYWFYPSVARFVRQERLNQRVRAYILRLHPILQTVVVHQGPLSDSNVADPSAVAIARVKRAKAAHFQSVRDLVWWTARGGGSRSSFIRPDVVRQFMFLEPTQQLRCCP